MNTTALVNSLKAPAPAGGDNAPVARSSARTSGGRREQVRCQEERLLKTELWQFAGAVVAFVVAALLWIRLVYLPGHTLERWENRRPRRRGGEHNARD
jgi:hypothetical protein